MALKKNRNFTVLDGVANATNKQSLNAIGNLLYSDEENEEYEKKRAELQKIEDEEEREREKKDFEARGRYTTKDRDVFNIPITEIGVRPINDFKQERIDEMVRDIRATNNRLIHPITVVLYDDLPEDSEIKKAFREKGIECSTKFIISSGERRFTAWKRMHDEEEAANRNNPDFVNPFTTIKANILTAEEAKLENAFYRISNLQARQYRQHDVMFLCKEGFDAVGGIKTDPQTLKIKSKAMAKVLGYSDEEYDARQKNIELNMADYLVWYLNNISGYEMSKASAKKYVQVLKKNNDEIVIRVIAGKLSLMNAVELTRVTSPEKIKELLSVLDEEGQKKMAELLNQYFEEKKQKKSVEFITAKDVEKKIVVLKNHVKKDRDELEKMAASLGKDGKAIIKNAIRDADKLMESCEKIIAEIKPQER